MLSSYSRHGNSSTLQRDENRGVNKSIEKIKREKETVPLRSIALSEWLAKELPSSLLFSFEHRSICMGKILTRIKSMALGEVLFDGYGNSLPTELPTSPKQLDEIEEGHLPDFHNSKIADMADSLRASPTSSLWGAIPSCGKCGESVQLPDRLSMSTPRPNDPTLSKYLHHSQRQLNHKSKSETNRPSTAPSNLQSSRKQTTNSKSALTKRNDDHGHQESPGPLEESRPSSARSVTFSDTDQVVEFTSQVVEFD